MAYDEPRTLAMEIDRRKVYFPEGATVLRAAELNGVSIPSLCSHKDLTPFGGCRLCMVEIEGVQGYPLSCTTTAQEGMKVATDSERLRELRRDVLKLILSEHPSSCLICGESEACRTYQGTIRKAGVTTGCRFCPNDDDCELQSAVDKIGLPELDLPILYHGYEPEHDDPFYDRDYNICILCGRCVRMCQEVRGTSVLAFTYRGPKVKIGPAFGRTHREAGCEFCGACVDVCPTGALADKVSKWNGRPEARHVSTCPFCAVGCQLELDVVRGRLSKAKAHPDPDVNDGQLCLKGRFCLPEATHHFERGKKPVLKKGEYFREVGWDEALAAVADRLRGLRPGEFEMRVSPDLSNESLFAARKFVREGLGLTAVESSARGELGGGFDLWRWLFSRPISLGKIAQAEAIVAVGLDSRFDFSVVGTKVRKALGRGAVLLTIDPRESNLARYTDHWLRPLPGREGILFEALAKRLAGLPADLAAAAKASGAEAAALERAAALLSGKKETTVILGPQVFHYDDTAPLIAGLTALSEHAGVNFIPLYFGANARGVLEMGVLPDAGADENQSPPGRRPKVIYLVGEVPDLERPDCDFLISQDVYPMPYPVDAFLPASSFAEAGGTLVNLEGRVQDVVQAEHFPESAVTGKMRPDWLIFADLARLLGKDGLGYRTPQDVVRDIRREIPDFPSVPNRKPRRMPETPPPASSSAARPFAGKGDFLLVGVPAGYRHRGFDLASKVGGLGELALEEGFRMHPEDLAGLGIAPGEDCAVILDGHPAAVVGPAYADNACLPGTIAFTKPAVFGGLGHRRGMSPLYGDVPNPVRVSLRKAGSRDGKG
ncbi:MAG: 2Fe-2S iron-sulfur cluster binding domain-containing protein [Candidatus Aminicenantes bacterium]|nr:2Fe-2S iron-sulfur cluster binding domain-containing protein [Candidatus Aminicenantes bacterium]